jgi:hypothetical protein
VHAGDERKDGTRRPAAKDGDRDVRSRIAGLRRDVERPRGRGAGFRAHGANGKSAVITCHDAD